MKRTRFSEEQIIGLLKEVEAGAKTRRHGMSEATIYSWKSKYGGLEVCVPHAFGSRGSSVEGACERKH